MVRLKDLTLLDTGRAATLEDTDGTTLTGHIIADPLYSGKLAFKMDNGEIIDIFITDRITFS